MFRILTSFLVVALGVSTAAAVSAQEYPPPGELGPPSAAAATARPDPLVLMRAKSWFAALQSGKIDRSELAPGPNANMTEATIENAQRIVGNLGRPVSFVQQQSSTQGGVTAVIYVVTFKNGQKVDFLFAVDDQGKVEGLGLGTPR
jgi:hypothetical protein